MNKIYTRMNAADSIDNNDPKNVPLGHEESGQGKIGNDTKS